MLDTIISSKTRIAVLSFLFANSDNSFSSIEIAKATDLDPANIHKELNSLVSGNFLEIKEGDDSKRYAVNQGNPYFIGLSRLFEIHRRRTDRDKWFTVFEMPGYYPMVVANATYVARANRLFKDLGIKNRFSKALCIYHDGACSLNMIKREFNAVAAEMVETIVERPQWVEDFLAETEMRQKKLDEATERLLKTNLTALSNKELLALYEKYYATYHNLHAVHWVQTCVDFGDNAFSKYLMEYLKGRLKNRRFSLGEVFAALTTPTKEGNATKEHLALIKLLGSIAADSKLLEYFKKTETRIIARELASIDKDLDRSLENHVQNFGWLGYGTVGPGWKKDYFIDVLGSLVRQGASPEKLLRDLESERRVIAKKQRQFAEELGIDDRHQRLFAVARGLVYSKGSRKDCMFHSFAAIEHLYREVGRRFYLSLTQVRYFYPHEFRALLTHNRFSAGELNERFRYSIHYSVGDVRDDRILIGSKAKEFVQKLEFVREEVGDIKQLQGDCASAGRARGPVTVVNEVKDMEKMKEGNVLVSCATSPDLVPAIRKASAIVTDIGGITCHAAIISREMGIPCVIGTKFATKALPNGTLIDVDATHGKVTIIKKAK